MSATTIDSLARLLARPASRRASILTVGGSGLAAVTGFSLAASGKKKRKKNKDKKCKQQVEQCNGVFALVCEENTDPAACLAATTECCAFLSACQADEFLNCFLAQLR